MKHKKTQKKVNDPNADDKEDEDEEKEEDEDTDLSFASREDQSMEERLNSSHDHGAGHLHGDSRGQRSVSVEENSDCESGRGLVDGEEEIDVVSDDDTTPTPHTLLRPPHHH